MSVRIPECYKKYLITQDPQHCRISERCKGWGCKYISCRYPHKILAMS